MKHQYYTCPQPCEKTHCQYCDGGLAYCVVCKKGEAELAEHCPGAPDETSKRADARHTTQERRNA